MTDEEKWQAISKNDKNYDGVFFYCVRSTGIFCRPSCKSKLPRRDNVFFVDLKQEATDAGFRPCKRCRSDLVTYKPLQEVAIKVKQLTEDHWKDSLMIKQEMRALGFSEHRLVQIFKDEYNITPNEYMAEKKLEYAKDQLRNTHMRIVDIAYDLGFNSLSSFYKFFKDRTGTTPAEFRKNDGFVPVPEPSTERRSNT